MPRWVLYSHTAKGRSKDDSIGRRDPTIFKTLILSACIPPTLDTEQFLDVLTYLGRTPNLVWFVFEKENTE
jgi:hypothetical protein